MAGARNLTQLRQIGKGGMQGGHLPATAIGTIGAKEAGPGNEDHREEAGKLAAQITALPLTTIPVGRCSGDDP